MPLYRRRLLFGVTKRTFCAARPALSAFPAMPIAFEFVEPLLSVCTACAVPCLTNGSSVAIVVTGFNLYVSVPT